MAVEIRSVLEELKGVAQEIYNLNKRIKEFRLRKKELESKVVDYLTENNKTGVKLDNIVFLSADKNARARKKKADVEKDTAEVLKKHGVNGDTSAILQELAEARKGEASTVPVLKMKAAGIFS